MSRGKVSLLVFLVLAFFVGTGYGVYVMSLPANNSSGVSMTVNDSAFPVVNNTTTNTTLTKNTTKKQQLLQRRLQLKILLLRLKIRITIIQVNLEFYLTLFTL